MMDRKFLSQSGWLTAILAVCVLAGSFRAVAGINVLQRHNDLAQTGANTNETILTPANVSSATFGKRFRQSVDGQVYAQPLVLTGVTIPGKGVHNVVYIATQHDSVYAFDADNADGPNSEPLWHVSFLNPDAGVTVFVPSDIPGVDNAISPELGITGTPVIDPDTGTLYVVAYTKEPGPVFVNRLHALDVATGAEKPGSPVEIKASVIGFGSDSVDGVVSFNSKLQLNRCGLTLAKNPAHPAGLLCIAFTSHDGFGNYRGWLMGYNPRSLTQNWAYCTTPNNLFASIWMSGAAPAVDSDGSIYVASANGPFDPSVEAYGDSVLKLSDTMFSDLGNSVGLVDYFAPHNAQSLYLNDLDLGSGGVMLLPPEVGSVELPNLMVAAGKFGTIFVLNRDNLGQFNAKDDSQVPQVLPNLLGTTGNSMWGAPAYFNGRIYYHPVSADIQVFGVANGRVSSAPIDQGNINSKSFPGPTPSISANGTEDGILWEIQMQAAGAQPPVLRAYNATNVASVLYESRQAGARDVPGGNSVKFTVPTVANGKVYVGSGGSVDVYGLLGAKVPTPVLTPGGGAVPPGTQVVITNLLQSALIRYTLDGSDPTSSSPLYTAPIVVTNPVTVIAKAFVAGLTESTAARGDFRLFVLGEGTGLSAAYFGNAPVPVIAGAPTFTRLEQFVSGDWRSVAPDPIVVGREFFCVSWRGYVQAQYSETYTFYGSADDGIRVWINGQPLIDQWVYQGYTTYSNRIALEAGKFYPIQVDYFQGAQGAEVDLEWSSPSTARQLVPTSQLYPDNQPPEVSIISPPSNVAVTKPVTVTLKSRVTDPDGTSFSVIYYQDGSPIATLLEAPYTLALTNLSVGSHVFYAEVIDERGATTRSSLRLVNVSGEDTGPAGLATAPPTFVPADAGTGLTGDYYADNPNQVLAGAPTLSRLDPMINYYWSGPPNPSLGTNLYCISWRGYIKPKFSETYVFYAGADDGVRLWVGGKLLVNAWYPQAATVYTNTLTLVAGQLYPVQMDYFQFFGGASAGLSWSSPSTPVTYIPKSQLFPPNRPPTVQLMSPTGAITNVAPANLALTATASDPDGVIARVIFYENGVMVGNVSAPPYAMALNNLQKGNHFIYAEAFDNLGMASRSAPVVVTVVSPPTGPYGLVKRPIVEPFLNLPSDTGSAWPVKLSGVGAFANTATLTVSESLIPYTVNVPFWSDGAVKRRWFALPYDGALPVATKWQIAFSETNDWQFPVGTVFVKHMDLATNQLDTNSLRRLETRVLVNLGAGQVRAATYRWRTDSSDADLVNSSQTEDIAVQTPSGVVTQRWFYPSPSDCLTCHTIQSGGILGTSKTRQMNCVFPYAAPGVADNQIRALNNIAAFNPAVDESVITNYARLAAAHEETVGIEIRARSFLDVNCAYCHFPSGTGQGAFDARITTPLSLANLINGSVQGGIPGSRTIVPGDLVRSRIYQRVNTSDPLAKMPPLARNLIDEEGAELLSRWIDSLAGPSPVLNVTLQSGHPILSWLPGTNQWYLQQSSGIGVVANWSAGPTPSISGNQATVSLSATNETRFFRLNSAAPIP